VARRPSAFSLLLKGEGEPPFSRPGSLSRGSLVQVSFIFFPDVRIIAHLLSPVANPFPRVRNKHFSSEMGFSPPPSNASGMFLWPGRFPFSSFLITHAEKSPIDSLSASPFPLMQERLKRKDRGWTPFEDFSPRLEGF